VGFPASTVLCRVFNRGVKPRCPQELSDTSLRAMAEAFTTFMARVPLPGDPGGRTRGETDPRSAGGADGRATTSEPP